MKLAEKLAYLRKEKRLSQLQLAEMMNVSRQAVSRWETGAAVPTADSLKYLSKLYEVSLDYLLNDDADEPERKKAVIEKPEEGTASTPDLFEETEEESVSAPAPINDQKTNKWKAAKLVVVALVILALSATIYIMYLLGRNEEDFVPINDVERREVQSEVESEFDIEW